MDEANSNDADPGRGASQPWLEVVGSCYFLDWLAEQQVSLAFTTYQTGKVFFVGRKPDHQLSVFERTFAHSMGLCAADDGRTLWMSSRYQIWRLWARWQVVDCGWPRTDGRHRSHFLFSESRWFTSAARVES